MSVTRRRDNDNWLIDVSDRFGRCRKTVSSQQYAKRQAKALERRLRQEREEEQAKKRRQRAGHRWSDPAARYWQENGRHLSWAVTVKGHLDTLSDALGDATPVDQITPDLVAGIFGRRCGGASGTTLNRPGDDPSSDLAYHCVWPPHW